jgi:hypothetical protein
MTRKSGLCSWPPLWTTTRHDPTDKPVGEIGILEQALMHELVNNRIFLFIQFESFRYMGSLSFDEPVFCRQICSLLNVNVGHSMKEIGDLDVSYTL